MSDLPVVKLELQRVEIHSIPDFPRSGHNLETALATLRSDLWRDLNRKTAVVFAFLDLSGPFGTVNNNILLAAYDG